MHPASHDDIIDHFRQLRRIFQRHPFWESIVSHLDDLIASGLALKTERAELLADRDAQKARADKAETDLATAQKQLADDDAKAAAAAADLQAEVTAEGPTVPVAPVTLTVGAPVAAPSTVVTITGDAPATGSAISGDGIASGATVVSAVASAVAGEVDVTLSAPTVSDIAAGEVLTVTASTAG